jgi:hypothetical protein
MSDFIVEPQHTCSGKRHLFEILVRNGYFLPTLRSSIINFDYLAGVRQGTITVPRYHELKFRACFQPPHKQLLIDELLKVTWERGLEIGFDSGSKAVPNKEWLLFCLSTYAPNHPIFNRAYVPPKRIRVERVEEKLNNDDGLFTGLDHIQSRYDKLRGKN